MNEMLFNLVGSVDRWLPLVILGGAALLMWKTGKMFVVFKMVERKDHPVAFWSVFGVLVMLFLWGVTAVLGG